MTSSLMAARYNSKRYRIRMEVDDEAIIQINDEISAPSQGFLSQLKAIPRDAEALAIENLNIVAPNNSEWAALGDHLTRVRDLALHAGWDEYLNDEKIPLHWPLERLLFSGSCGDPFRSPWVLESRVKHLILLFTSGLRFEGPTNEELVKAHQEAIARGEREKKTVTFDEGTPNQHEMEVTFVPGLAHEWMHNKHAGKPQFEDDVVVEEQPKPLPMQLQTFEKIENDALDTFVRFILANAHRDMKAFTTLVLRSTNGCDCRLAPRVFRQLLPQMTQLRTLMLTVGEKTFEGWEKGNEDVKAEMASIRVDEEGEGDNSTTTDKEGREDEKEMAAEKIPSTESSSKSRLNTLLTTLYTSFPPNLQCLRFRGPASLIASPHWPDWVAAFSSPDFLPDLKTLSFVLDLDVGVSEREKNWKAGQESEKAEWERGEMERKKVGTEMLRKAKRECERVWEGVTARGIEVQVFRDHWAGQKKWFKFDVDERWAEL